MLSFCVLLRFEKNDTGESKVVELPIFIIEILSGWFVMEGKSVDLFETAEELNNAQSYKYFGHCKNLVDVVNIIRLCLCNKIFILHYRRKWHQVW